MNIQATPITTVKPQNRSQVRDILKSFLPWILYFLLTGHSQQELDTAIIVAVIAVVIFDYKALADGFILSWGTLLFFLFMLTTVCLFKIQWIAQYDWIFSNSALAIIAWGSILLKKPFTIQYAKKQVAEDKWEHPIFLKINYILTIVWGLMFTLSLSLHIVHAYHSAFSNNVYELVSYIPTVFAIWFTVWFPKQYRKNRVM